MRKPFRIDGRPGWHAEYKDKEKHAVRRSFEKHADAETWLKEEVAKVEAETGPMFGGPSRISLGQMLVEYAHRFTLVKGGCGAELGRINHYVTSVGLPRLEVVVEGDRRKLVSVDPAQQPPVPFGFQKHLMARLHKRQRTYELIGALARKKVNAVTTDDIRMLHTTMVADGLSTSTAQKEVALLKAAFNSAIREWGWKRLTNPCVGIKLGKSNQRFVRVSRHDMERLVQALAECDNAQFWPLVDLAIHTTQRQGTLLGLTWDKVNLDTREAHVWAKGSWAVMQLSTRAVELLRSVPRNGTNRVFTMTANAVNMAWEGVREKAGLPQLTFRDLRHVGATAYAKAGVGPHALKGILLHTTTRMSEVYVNLAHSDIHDALDAADAKLNDLTPMPPTRDPNGLQKHPRQRKVVVEAPASGSVFHVVRERGTLRLVAPDATSPAGAAVPATKAAGG